LHHTAIPNNYVS